MGVSIIDKTSVFDMKNSLGKLVPVMSGLTALHFDGITSGLNQCLNGSAFTVVGSPVNEGDYITSYNKSAFVKTQSPCTSEGTFITVVRLFLNKQGYNNTVLGWYPLYRGVSLILNESEGLQINCNVKSADGGDRSFSSAISVSTFTSETSPYTGRWAAVMARWGKNSDGIFSMELKNITSGQRGINKAEDGDELVTEVGGYPFVIGSGIYGSSISGDEKSLAATALYNRALSDLDVQSMYVYLKGYFSRRGISI